MLVIIGYKKCVMRKRKGIGKARFGKVEEGKLSPPGKKLIFLFVKGIYQEIM